MFSPKIGANKKQTPLLFTILTLSHYDIYYTLTHPCDEYCVEKYSNTVLLISNHFLTTLV